MDSNKDDVANAQQAIMSIFCIDRNFNTNALGDKFHESMF